MARPGGNVVAVGTPDLSAEVTYSPLALFQNKNLLGIRYGGPRPRADFPMLADMYLRGRYKLDELVSNTAGYRHGPRGPHRPAPFRLISLRSC